MGPGARLQPLGCGCTHRAVGVYGMDRTVAGLVVGGEHVPACVVGGQIAGLAPQLHISRGRQIARLLVDGVARQYERVAPPGIECGAVRVEGQGPRSAGNLDGAVGLKAAGLRVH